MGVPEFILPQKHNTELADEITLLAGQINAANYRFLTLIAEFDERDAWNGDGIRSCAHWLNWKCGIALGAAREKIRVARSLQALPQINQAFSSGEISYSKVRAMTRVATNENEDYLLMIAKHGTATHIEQLVKKYQPIERQLKSSEEPKQKLDPHQQRKMTSFQDDEGMWHIHAKLPAETGALIVKAIDAILLQEKEAKKNVPAGTFSDDEASNDEVLTSTVPFEHRRVDALATMAEHYLASASNDNGIKTLTGHERCQVMLHVDINTLNANASSHPSHKHCNIDNKHWIAPETAKRLCCDASLVTVLEDDKGNVLNIGRRSRTIPSSIKKALSLRDTSCQFPGCCSTSYLDAHHIKHWADGGVTSLDNLTTLCRHHHRELHKGHFNIKHEQSTLVFTTAKGKRLERSFVPQRLMTTPSNIDRTFIDKNTAITQWEGEKMDYDMAVSGLLNYCCNLSGVSSKQSLGLPDH